jgi:orotidine-5'-phosphate decarboxylase
MESPSWIELVERNVARFGDLVAGIDPSLSDIPSFSATTARGSSGS